MTAKEWWALGKKYETRHPDVRCACDLPHPKGLCETTDRNENLWWVSPRDRSGYWWPNLNGKDNEWNLRALACYFIACAIDSGDL